MPSFKERQEAWRKRHDSLYRRSNQRVEASPASAGHTRAANPEGFPEFEGEGRNLKNINSQIAHVTRRRLMNDIVKEERDLLLGGDKNLVSLPEEIAPNSLGPMFQANYAPYGNKEIDQAPTPNQTLTDEERLPRRGGKEGTIIGAETGLGNIDTAPGLFTKSYDYVRSAMGHEFQHAKDYEQVVAGELDKRFVKEVPDQSKRDELVSTLMEIRAYQSELDLAEMRGLGDEEKTRIHELIDIYRKKIPSDLIDAEVIAVTQFPLVSDKVLAKQADERLQQAIQKAPTNTPKQANPERALTARTAETVSSAGYDSTRRIEQPQIPRPHNYDDSLYPPKPVTEDQKRRNLLDAVRIAADSATDPKRRRGRGKNKEH